jgi:uncharacterized integral membrane protein
MKFKNILSFIFIALIVVFSLQNAEATDVNFLFWKVSISRVLVILGSFSIGALVGLLMSVKFKSNRQNSF